MATGILRYKNGKLELSFQLGFHHTVIFFYCMIIVVSGDAI